jgi:hypothetical protein
LDAVIFETQFSLYEADDDKPQVRRLAGFHDPTPRQGEDGEWKEYVEMSPVVVGEHVIICWRWNTERGVMETTITSLVEAIR